MKYLLTILAGFTLAYLLFVYQYNPQSTKHLGKCRYVRPLQAYKKINGEWNLDLRP